ncbi:MAG: cytochrome-c peroxidase, partial [Chloroflexi bacterium]|nr:cytochrome-c peroxidase [Chloroflexota bacterium]
EDVGVYALTLNQTDYGAFRTAPLREVAQTAPYMHNGTLATLTDVVKFYNIGGGKGNKVLKPLNLNDDEVKQLVAFLESLSSEQLKVEVPLAPNYQTRPLGDNK